MSRYLKKAAAAAARPQPPRQLSQLEEFLLRSTKNPMNIAQPVVPISLDGTPRGFLLGSTVRPGAPLSVRQLPIPWNNMDYREDAPGLAWNHGVEEVFAGDSVTRPAQPIPRLRSQIPAWSLSGVEGMENRMRTYSSNGRRGRGFRTRRGGRTKERKSTLRRKRKHTA
jgi:hypothetical protein